MNRLAKFAAAGLAFVPAFVFAQNSQTIYKFVDESGRVTYANSPIKGGTKVNLDPLTVIQSSPAASSNSVPAAQAIPVAKVTSVPSPTSPIKAVPVAFAATVVTPSTVPESAAPPPTIIAALDTGDKVQERTQQRRTEIRRRILLGEIQAEEKSLEAARAALAEEQRRSAEMRSMRASFAATAVGATPTKPLISPEIRAEIERHFERVRNLQDEVKMHEGSITTLREEMVAQK